MGSQVHPGLDSVFKASLGYILSSAYFSVCLSVHLSMNMSTHLHKHSLIMNSVLMSISIYSYCFSSSDKRFVGSMVSLKIWVYLQRELKNIQLVEFAYFGFGQLYYIVCKSESDRNPSLPSLHLVGFDRSRSSPS